HISSRLARRAEERARLDRPLGVPPRALRIRAGGERAARGFGAPAQRQRARRRELRVSIDAVSGARLVVLAAHGHVVFLAFTEGRPPGASVAVATSTDARRPREVVPMSATVLATLPRLRTMNRAS